MDFGSYTTAQEAMWAGFIPFGLCSYWGLRLLFRGLRGEIADSLGAAVAPRTVFMVGGILLQLPLAGYTLFVWRQGLFGS
jgi:hypothetical protein